MNTNQDIPGRTQASVPRRRSAPRLLTAGLAALPLLLASCGGGSQMLFMGDQASWYNQEIWRMSLWAIGLSIIIFIAVSWALFTTVHRFREENHTAEPAQFHGNNRLEVILVVVPILIVIFLSVLAVMSMVRLNPVSERSLNVESLGKQFWWNFSYPQSKVGGGVVTNGNELIIPTKQNVAMTTTSGDVIHGFWAPNLGGQRAAVPSSKKTWNIDTGREGVYQGNCSQLCGASHANMRFKVVALDQARYDAFIKAATAYTAPTPAAGSAEERGMNLFMQGNPSTGAVACASCHRVQGTNANGASGPDLSFFGTRRTLGAGMWEAMSAEHWADPKAAAELHAWIKDSPGVKPGSLMPTYDGSTHRVNGKDVKGGVLTDAQIDDIAAYLRSLKLPDEADYWKGVPIHGTNTTAGGTQ